MNAVCYRKSIPSSIGRKRIGNPFQGGNRAGLTLLETVVGISILVIAGAGTFQALNLFNRTAAETRVFNNAKAIAQERIDKALTLDFDPSGTPAFVPAILELGTRNTNVDILLDENGIPFVSGTLTERVSTLSNPANIDYRSLEVEISYAFGRKNFSYSISTLRAPDS